MLKYFREYLRSEDGAVTVDWVLLTALIVGLQVATMLTPLREALVNMAYGIAGNADEAKELMENP